MRTEGEMMNRILGVAGSDPRVKAVFMNGSRTNINAPKDPFQDFDIVYIVPELESFIKDVKWTDVFGELIIMQKPDEMDGCPDKDRYAYLMQFADGNRIDLTLIRNTKLDEYLHKDSLTVMLLDKEGNIPPLNPPTDEDYRVKKPDEVAFKNCCNEFWWVAPYVAKGLWRNEMLYAKGMVDFHVRPELIRMLSWEAGFVHNFGISVGKMGKYLSHFISPVDWERLLSTYAPGQNEETWDALLNACNLFHDVALRIAGYLNVEYNINEDEAVAGYIRHIRALSPDASVIY